MTKCIKVGNLNSQDSSFNKNLCNKDWKNNLVFLGCSLF